MIPSSSSVLLLAGFLVSGLPGAAHHPYARPHRLHRPAVTRPAAAPVAAAPAAAAGDDDVEAVEAVEAVTPPAATAEAPSEVGDHIFGVAPDAAAKVTTAAGLAALLGHLHPALVHLPVAWVILWAALELAGMLRKRANAAWDGAALTLAVVTTASFAPAVLTGLCRLDELASATRGYEAAEALVHRNLIYLAAALCALGLVFRGINARWPNGISRLASFLVVAGACAVTGFSAHLGGRMVYGADFLPF